MENDVYLIAQPSCRPVGVYENATGAVIQCSCGFTTASQRFVDDAWDEYDNHTMKEDTP